MTLLTIPRPLRDALGEEATDAFIEVMRNVDLEGKRDLATKSDIQQVKSDIQQVKSDIQQVKTELENKIDKVKTELENKIDKVKIELSSEIKLLRWMVGLMLAGVVSLVLKAFFMH